MTNVLKQSFASNYHYSITLEQEKETTGYHVVVSEKITASDPYYRICKRDVYPTIEQANKRFNYLKRKAITGTL